MVTVIHWGGSSITIRDGGFWLEAMAHIIRARRGNLNILHYQSTKDEVDGYVDYLMKGMPTGVFLR